MLLKANPTVTNLRFIEVNSISRDVAGKAELRVYPTMVQNNFNIEVPGGYKQTKKMNITVLDAVVQLYGENQTQILHLKELLYLIFLQACIWY